MVASRAAHINGCPCCRAQITPGMTPLDAVPGRNNLLTASDRDQIASRARAARRAVMARFLSRQGGAGGGTGQQQGQQRGQQQGHAHMRPRYVGGMFFALVCVVHTRLAGMHASSSAPVFL